jgi:hypothetical protein
LGVVIRTPYLLPPTWNKDLNKYGAFIAVWRNAARLIEVAQFVMIIGHSFPATDTHLQYLLAEGFSRSLAKPQSKGVMLVDSRSDVINSVKERLVKFQSFSESGLITRTQTFADFVESLPDSEILANWKNSV